MNDLLSNQQISEITGKISKFLSTKGIINVQVSNRSQLKGVYSFISGAILQKIKKEESISNLVNSKIKTESITSVESISKKHTPEELISHIHDENVGFLFIDQSFFFYDRDNHGKFGAPSDPIPAFHKFYTLFDQDSINCLNTVIYLYIKNDRNYSVKNDDLAFLSNNLHNTKHLNILVNDSSLSLQTDESTKEYNYVLE